MEKGPFQLDTDIGLTRGDWGRFERGETMPGFDKMVRIAKYCGESLDNFYRTEKEIMLHIGTDLANISHLKGLLSTAIFARLLTALNSMFIKTDLKKADMTRIVACLEMFAELMDNPLKREEYLNLIENHLKLLRRLEAPKQTIDYQ